MPSAADTDSSLEGLGSLIRFTGATVPARARFIGETMLGASLSSITLGVVCGQVGSTFFPVLLGPLIPFLCGSWIGYSAGLVSHWHHSKQITQQYAQKYPALMMYALEQEANITIPEHVQKDVSQLSTWLLSGPMGRTARGVLAAQSCRDSVEEIEQRGRERAAAKYNATEDGE